MIHAKIECYKTPSALAMLKPNRIEGDFQHFRVLLAPLFVLTSKLKLVSTKLLKREYTGSKNLFVCWRSLC